MKYCLFSVVLTVFMGIQIGTAQVPERPNSILAKKIWIDHFTPANGEFTDFENFTDGFEVAYLHNLRPWLNVTFPLKAGVIHLPEEINNRKIFGLDAVGQFQYYKKDSPLIPYALVGVGGVLEDFDNLDLQVPLGLGVYYKLGKFGFINLQGEYRRSLDLERHNFQYGIGLGFMIGEITEEDLATTPVGEFSATDQDFDGVPDEKDDCPEKAGLAQFGGCPDSDGDGTMDMKDECPDEFGTMAAKGCPDTDKDGFANDKDECPDLAGSLNGCPDSDGDGVADKDDKCPGEAGKPGGDGCPKTDTDFDGVEDSVDACPKVPGKVNGCPDTDGDGIADKDDKCPFAAGEGAFGGCPDSDGDGIDDSRDRCPKMAAPSSPNGCPDIKEEDREVLDYAIQAVQFERGRNELKPVSFPVLDQIIDILNKYPDYHLNIVGHTDNTGSDKVNRKLSVARAQSCFNYLKRKGVGTNRMSIGGFGSTQPIATNDTAEGRKMNRRVEFNLTPK